MVEPAILAEDGTIEAGALDQLRSACSLPFVNAAAIMPDGHQGYSLPIGAVVLTHNTLVPSWVGYDIGCGMYAVPTTFDPQDVRDNAEAIHEQILDRVPVGYRHHTKKQGHPIRGNWTLSDIGAEAFERRGGWMHLGTLGGGNHFIEVGEGDDGRVWIVVHSGSRGPGHGVASAWMAHAACSTKPQEGHHALAADTPQGQAYYNDQTQMTRFALANRQIIAGTVADIMHWGLDGEGLTLATEAINKCHNEVVGLSMLRPSRASQFIHRKGATSANAGEPGVIPGNMRDGSYIVEGTGNPKALWSSSHGAGRLMGRKQAKRELDLEDFQTQMAEAGVTGQFDEARLDEAPGAYKKISEVIKYQASAGMLKVVAHIEPIVNVKG